MARGVQNKMYFLKTEYNFWVSLLSIFKLVVACVSIRYEHCHLFTVCFVVFNSYLKIVKLYRGYSRSGRILIQKSK